MRRPGFIAVQLVLAAALATAGCMHSFSLGVGDAVRGSGVRTTQTRATGPFQAIRLVGSPDVEVTVGAPLSVVVEADDNVIDFIETEVTGRTLEIAPTKSYSMEAPARVRISLPSLEGVHVTGSGDVSIAGLDADLFEATVTGSGDVRARGLVRELEASVNGSGDLWLEDLEAETVYATVHGSGDIRVHARQALSGKIYGSGDIVYSGSPGTVRDSVRGSGDLIAR